MGDYGSDGSYGGGWDWGSGVSAQMGYGGSGGVGSSAWGQNAIPGVPSQFTTIPGLPGFSVDVQMTNPEYAAYQRSLAPPTISPAPTGYYQDTLLGPTMRDVPTDPYGLNSLGLSPQQLAAETQKRMAAEEKKANISYAKSIFTGGLLGLAKGGLPGAAIGALAALAAPAVKEKIGAALASLSDAYSKGWSGEVDPNKMNYAQSVVYSEVQNNPAFAEAFAKFSQGGYMGDFGDAPGNVTNDGVVGYGGGIGKGGVSSDPFSQSFTSSGGNGGAPMDIGAILASNGITVPAGAGGTTSTGSGGTSTTNQKSMMQMLQEWFTSTGMGTATQLQQLAGLTGGLTDEEKGLLNTVQQNAINKLTDTINTQRDDIMEKAIAKLTGRGVMDSTIASGLIGDIEKEVLKQIGQGTADITSDRMKSELSLTESRAARAQDWQKSLLNAYFTGRGQDLGVSENESDRQLRLAIENMQADYVKEANDYTLWASIGGSLLNNWGSIFGNW